MGNWTKGPWEVYSDDEVISRSEKTEEGCPTVVIPDSCVFERDYGDQIGGRDKRAANAKLIAAAPELFEALESIITNATTATCSRGQLDMAMRALKKAKGEKS